MPTQLKEIINARSRVLMIVIAILFSIWAAWFVFRTSFIAIDGDRYFSLFDDAMISMRYAWNLAHGIGPVWNQGEFVEGYTNPLMVLLMAIPSFFLTKPMAVLVVQVFGILTMLLNAFMATNIYKLIPRHEPTTGTGRLDWLVFGATLAYYPLTYFTLMGMETGLLALFLTTVVYLSIKVSLQPKIRTYALLGIISGMAFLTRPDSLIFIPIIFIYLTVSFIQKRKDSGVKWHVPLLGLLLFGILVVGSRIIAYAYYGSILPNTYILKVDGMPLSIRLLGGFRFVLRYITQTFPLLLLCVGEIIFDARPTKLMVCSFPFVAIIYQIYVGGDPWPYWRIMASSSQILIVASVLALEAITTAVSKTEFAKDYFKRRTLFPTSSLAPFFAILGLISMMLFVNKEFDREIVGLDRPYSVASNEANLNVAIALRQVTCPEATVGVFWAGTIPYYVDRYAVDFLGKSDPYIASLPPDLSGSVSWAGMSSVPGHNKYDLYYSIQTLHPTYVQRWNWGTQDVREWGEDHYSLVYYQGVALRLIAASDCVYWDLLDSQ